MNDRQRFVAITILGAIAIACIAAGTVMSVQHVDAGPLWAALGTAIGAIAGVLVPASKAT